MLLSIPDVLPADLLTAASAAFGTEAFADGTLTAGWHAKLVKNNVQMQRSDTAKKLEAEIIRCLMSHPVFQMAVRPKMVSPLLFSAYTDGQHYGKHVDDAIQRAGLRTDVSFTIFLSDPKSYTGGELCITAPFGDQTIKLPRGTIVIYPSSSLHEVKPVTKGTRQVCVGWAQSLIRDPAQREILFDLDRARRAIFDKDGKTDAFDQLTKSSANLVRMWAEV